MNIRQIFMVLTCIVLALTAMNGPVFAAGQAAPVNKVDVLISFSRLPGPAEQAQVSGLGGNIKYTYRLVPAIAASIPDAAMAHLLGSPHVVAVEPDVQAALIDAELDSAWGVKRIGAGTVHEQGNKGAGVKIGIIDSGIDLDHPDLQYDPSCSASFVVDETLDDGYGHGTHVAGIVAGLDNDFGVVGAAPEATLCIYKAFSNRGTANYSDIIAALERAVTDGVQVTNNSYGSSEDPGSTVKAAFDSAYAAGVLHIGAAGNLGNFFGTGETCLYPARWDTVVATAATTQADTRAIYSSTCAEMELAAPGDQIYSTIVGGGFGYKSGTSMAAPHAAGAAGLVLAAHPDWTNTQVRAQLQSTSADLGAAGRDPWYGFGLVDALAAAGIPPVNTPPTAFDQSAVTDANAPVSITLSASDPDGDLLTFHVVSGPSHGTLDGLPPGLTYTPDVGFSGADSFTFAANDGQAESNTATVSITVLPVFVESVASAEIRVTGTVGGDYTLTQADDGVRESITEKESGGKTKTRTSLLEHKWVFEIAPASDAVVYVNAWRSLSGDGEAFLFAYSTDNVTYTPMFSITGTTDAEYAAYTLPATGTGTIYIRVMDSDRTPGKRALDTVYVDHMYIRYEP